MLAVEEGLVSFRKPSPGGRYRTAKRFKEVASNLTDEETPSAGTLSRKILRPLTRYAGALPTGEPDEESLLFSRKREGEGDHEVVVGL